jgi:hypothetical protein
VRAMNQLRWVSYPDLSPRAYYRQERKEAKFRVIPHLDNGMARHAIRGFSIPNERQKCTPSHKFFSCMVSC